MNIRHAVRGALVLGGLVSISCTTTAHATSSMRSPTAQQARQPAADQVTVPLTDPSKPAAIHVSLVRGGITVRGTNRRDVLVTAHPDADRSSRRVDPDASGLRRLPQTAGYRVTEENNRLSVRADNPNQAVRFEIEAPRHVNLVLKTVNGGDILVEEVEGDLDVHNTNGGITLNSVAGSVVAVTTNGSVRATLTQVAAQKDMAFTSLNGNVDVTLPRRPICACAATTATCIRISTCSCSRSRRRRCRKTRAATGAIASTGPGRWSARSTAVDRSSSCGPSTATSTSARDAETARLTCRSI
jgi:hypothetical protein